MLTAADAVVVAHQMQTELNDGVEIDEWLAARGIGPMDEAAVVFALEAMAGAAVAHGRPMTGVEIAQAALLHGFLIGVAVGQEAHRPGNGRAETQCG